MYNIARRPLESGERNLLERVSRLSVNDDFGGAITFLAVLAVLGWALGWALMSFLPRGIALAITVSGTLALWIRLSYINIRTRLAEKRRFRLDLAAGEAEAIEGSSVAIVRQGTQNDDPFFYFVVDAEKALFLGGQELYEVESFPTREFTVFRAPVSKLVFRIEPRGPVVAPDRTIPRSAVEIADFGTCELLDLSNPALKPVLATN